MESKKTTANQITTIGTQLMPTETGFIIEFKTNGSPADTYVGMVNNLIDLLQRKKENPDIDDYYALELLRAMIPDYQSVKKLFQNQ